jgi:hypothetical protein
MTCTGLQRRDEGRVVWSSVWEGDCQKNEEPESQSANGPANGNPKMLKLKKKKKIPKEGDMAGPRVERGRPCLDF